MMEHTPTWVTLLLALGGPLLTYLGMRDKTGSERAGRRADRHEIRSEALLDSYEERIASLEKQLDEARAKLDEMTLLVAEIKGEVIQERVRADYYKERFQAVASADDAISFAGDASS